MSKTMLVNVVTEEESRIALVADGVLEELSIETARQEQIEGNIYKARIVKVIPSLDAVFVDYGRERNGFLAIPDIHHQYFNNDKRSAEGLRKGQDLMVQVKKGEIDQKGAALTTYVSLPGRYFVLMPQVNKRGVSRRIQKESTRDQLRKILDDSGIPEEMGYIARTAAEGRTKQELTRDANYLLRLWKNVQRQYKAAKGPALLYQETDIVIRTLRDYFTPAISEVLVDDEEIYKQVRSFFQAVMPWHTKRVRLHQGKSPLFSKHNVEDQIATIYDKRVSLPSGGSLVIEQTEALVSIDVNSGKTSKGKDIEETALIANKEAAEEAARQLRLRDLGGLIVIDFIDMRSSSHRNQVRKGLQKALKEDKARTETSTISKFGLLELSRQRIKGVARAADTQMCPLCSGAGKVRSAESAALATLRRLQLRLSRKGIIRQVLVGVPIPVANLLLNRKRQRLAELESRFDLEILIFPEPPLAANQYYLEYRTDHQPQIDCNLPEEFDRARLQAPKGLPDAPPRASRPSLYELHGDEEDTGRAEPEVPEEPREEHEDATAQAGEQENQERRTSSRRRRGRRRRKPSEGAAEQENEPQAEQAEETSGRPQAESAEDAETDEVGEDKSSKRLSPSAKRRLRRKRAAAAARAEKERQKAEEPAAAREPSAPPTETQTGPSDDSGAGKSAAEEANKEESKSSRGTNRSRKRSPRKSEKGEPTTDKEEPSAPEEADSGKDAKPKSIAAAAKEAAASKRVKAKRSKEKSESSRKTDPLSTPPAENAPVSPEPKDESPPTESPKKPARKPRKAKTAADPKASAEGESETAARKPARRTRKKTPPAEKTEEEEPQAAPKRRPRTRKAEGKETKDKTKGAGGGKKKKAEESGSGSES